MLGKSRDHLQTLRCLHSWLFNYTVCYWPSHAEVRILIGRILLKFEYNKVGHGHEMSRNVSFGKGPFS